jgi:predicted MPP superfamily phosphohydrolase
LAVRTIEHRGHALAIGGTELPWMGDAADFCNVSENAFRLLLSHSPDQFAFAKQHNVDLMLAGHTHGGQIRLPLLGPVYCPSVHGPLYSDGVYFEAGTALHVTRGLSGETPVRLNCPPELALLVLHG